MRTLALILLLMPLLALIAGCGEEEATGPDAAVQKFIGLLDFRASEVAIVGDGATVSWSGTWAYGMKGETGDTITVDSTLEFEDGVLRVLKIRGD